MTRLDLTPLFRNSIGTDRLARMLEHADHMNAGGYPPYNIIAVTDDEYVIEMAIAGFSADEISVTAQHGQLTITGSKVANIDEEGPNYLHQGISGRRFERVFNLADYIEVEDAEVKDGILTVRLERHIPDALKPKQIEVKTA